MRTRLLVATALLISCHAQPDTPRTPVVAAPPDAAIADAAPTLAEQEAELRRQLAAHERDVAKQIAERPDVDNLTTVKEYAFEPAARLTPVSGTAGYAALGKPRIVKFAVNVWAGWAPIILANQGARPKRIWKDGRGGEFQVQLVLVDNPAGLIASLAEGLVHLGWATVDMLPLLVQQLRDPRTMPRVFQQVDWSNGGDGLVVRDGIKNVAELRGKDIVLAQSSPSHYFLLDLLLNAGLQPSDVKLTFTKDAFQAAAAFNADKKFAAAVSWSPDIYNLTKPATGNKLLVSTTTANRLIADVWFARADFARDHPEILEGLVRGILDATSDLEKDETKVAVGLLMDEFFSLPKGTGKDMLGDAHWTNYAENRAFFLDRNNPTNFERTYDTAAQVYRAIGVIDHKVTFDKLVDFTILKKLGAEKKYADSKSVYEFHFTPVAAEGISVENSLLTRTVTISFFPNSFDLHKKIAKPSGKDVLYDPNVDVTIEEIAKLAGQFGAARVQISGHSDSSMRGQADESVVRELSLARAKAVKEELVNRFKMNPNQFVVAGYGWDKPADPNDPNNHAKNRRIEIKVIPSEAP